jgi:hypothetical protein
MLMYSIGGGGGYGSWPATNAVQVYDPGTDIWTQETVLPVAYGTNSADYCYDGIGMCAGGYDGNSNHDETYQGTGFPTGAHPLVPNVCENFTATADPMGDLSCDLSWDLPTTTVNGSPISSYPIISVEILRDEVPLVSLGPTATSYTDNSMTSAATYDYTIYAVNSYGEGLTAEAGTWVGLDIPSAPTNVSATSSELLTVDITWTAPTSGIHGGYFPPGAWDGQYIYRNGALLATLTGTNTSHTDHLPFSGNYVYGVSYYNASGEGPITNAPEIYVPGPPQYQAAECPYNWIEVNATRPGALPGINTGINGDDQNLGPFPIGFGFPSYSGVLHNEIRVCSNGFASFTSNSTTYFNVVIPNTYDPNNLLAVYWDDLNLSPSYHGSVWYYSDPGDDYFILEFDSCAAYGTAITGEYFTFEIILYPDGIINYMYKDVVLGSMTAPSATVGIENDTGEEGLQCTYNNSGPLEPVSGYGIRIGPLATHDVEIQLVYLYGSPIPPTGGVLACSVYVDNHETGAVNCDGWLDVTIPNSSVFTLILRELTMTGGIHMERLLEIDVPEGAPTGNYTLTGRLGNYPGDVWDDDAFPFVKLGSDSGAYHEGMFTVSGWFDDPATLTMEEIPFEFALNGVYPNPFNPSTVISYQLSKNSFVNLAVYDISGRKVAELVNGWRDSGVHEAVFEGTDLASGIYVLALKAGGYDARAKMVLIK